MRKKLLSYIQYIIFLGGGLFLVWWELHGMTVTEQAEFKYAITHANYILLIPVIIMNLAGHLSRSLRWKLLLEPLGYNPKLKNVFAATMVGYLANAAIPRLGEVLKCSILAKYEKLKVDNLIGSILIERTFDLITYGIFIAITVLIQINVIGSFFISKMKDTPKSNMMPLWMLVLIIIGVIFVIIFIIKKIFGSYPNNKVVIKIKGFLKGIGNGFAAIKNLKDRRAFLLHTIFIWGMYLLQIYIGFKAMEGTAHLGVKAACSVLTMSTLAMIATPNGIGTFPLLVMETLIVYHIDAPQGNAFGWLIWGVSTAIIITAGLISLVILPYINKQKNEIAPSNTQ